jgi:trans-aconitate methyltransferase
MARIPFNGVMDTPASVDGYIGIVLMPQNPASLFVELLGGMSIRPGATQIADLGCGPCMTYENLAELYPQAYITGIEASALMLEKAVEYINPSNTLLIQSTIPDFSLPYHKYDLVLSCLVLDGLAQANDLWNTINQIAAPGADFVIFDLVRVENSAECEAIAQALIQEATPQAKSDFISGLQAAYTKEEVEQQLAAVGMNATVSIIEAVPDVKFLLIQGKAR